MWIVWLALPSALALLLLGIGLFNAGSRRLARGPRVLLAVRTRGCVAGIALTLSLGTVDLVDLTTGGVALFGRLPGDGAEAEIPGSALLLCGGVLIACFVATIVYLWQTSRQRLLQIARLETDLAGRLDDMRTTETKFRNLLEATPDAMVVVNKDGRIETVNGQAERLFGYRRDELIGSLVEVLLPQRFRATHPAHRNGFDAKQARAMGAGMDLLALRHDGTEFPIEISLSPLQTGNETVILSAIRDVTDRRRTEVELRMAKEAAEAANEAKSRFLATMSHEIRTPMNAILGMADLLWESSLDDAQRQYVDIFRGNGHMLLALINDILDLSKIEAGRFELERVAFGLDDVVRQALEIIASSARAKELTLTLDWEDGTPSSLIGDPLRLRQVLVNLLGNAVKFTTRGEIRLTVASRALGTQQTITFAIADTGAGIAPEQLDRIFVDFAQADSSTTRKFGGTGLGLGISQRLVELMGGRLEVTSTVGEGSTFTFSGVFEVGRPEPVAREVTTLVGARVLVIDDDSVNRLVLRGMLAAWGADCHDFGEPERALTELARAVTEQQPYALAIVDGRMPEMDGFEAARRVHALAQALPVVMLASDAERGDELRRLEAGISGFAMKPINRLEFLRVISKAMGVRVGAPAEAVVNEPDRPGTRRLSILVAEDFVDNRVLINAYLRGWAHTITFADHGRHAVELFVSGRFDLVLMDVQMPVMDGLEATRAIRAFEAREGRRPTPIVAVTANAQAEAIEASRQAGCNEHLSKPVSKRTLLEALERLTGQGASDGGSEGRIQIEVPEGFEDLAPAYLEARRSDVTAAAALLGRDDFDGVRRLAHHMAGSGSSYGFPLVTALGQSLEQSTRAGDKTASAQYLATLHDYLARACITPVE